MPLPVALGLSSTAVSMPRGRDCAPSMSARAREDMLRWSGVPSDVARSREVED